MPITVSCPTRPEDVIHPFRGRVVLVASPAIDDRDAAGWWAWVQAHALPQEDPGYTKEQAWIEKARAHWPGRANENAYTEAWERDRLCAELLSANITEPPDGPAMDTDTGEAIWIRPLRPSMQDALVRGLLADGVMGSSDLCAAMAGTPNVALVRRILTDDAIAFVRHDDRHLERAMPGYDRTPRRANDWSPVWPGALNEVAEQHLWSNVGDKIDLLLDLGWPLEGVRWEHTPLSAAVRHHNMGALKALLARGADPDRRPMIKPAGPSSPPVLGVSAWCEAVIRDQDEVLRHFLAHGVIPTHADLEQAVAAGAHHALDLLIEHGIDPFPADETTRPGRLPRLLRRAALEVRREVREGFVTESGFTLNRRRLEQIWLTRAVEEEGREAGAAESAVASDDSSPLRRRL